MEFIAVSQIPSQRFEVTLNRQRCVIALRQKGKRIYLDLDVGDNPICRGAICLHCAEIVQSPSQYFNGRLFFFDTLGQTAPQWQELDTRYLFIYATDDEPIPSFLGV